ncbi:unnamed protein product [Brassica rapa]|uniref:Transmembrane protein n=1 Tax=Brassica campestris TaxID=3711 RepID=A0A3P6CYD0_BRACM|nr:unnamed protein product [Brassica rapa]VDD13432.1 unnamed protein product [Brassica rapa]
MANMPSSSKLLAVMLFSFVALFIISQARTFSTGTKVPGYPGNAYGPDPGYSPVPTRCFNPPYCHP